MVCGVPCVGELGETTVPKGSVYVICRSGSVRLVSARRMTGWRRSELFEPRVDDEPWQNGMRWRVRRDGERGGRGERRERGADV